MSREILYKDGHNEIVFKPSTKKVVIGINTSSYFKSKYRSFNAKTKEEALSIGVNYLESKNKI